MAVLATENAEDVCRTVRGLFLDDTADFLDHVDALQSHPSAYKVQLLLLMELVDLQRKAKVNALLAALETHDYSLADTLLAHRCYGFADVFAACKALDGKRRMRAWTRSLTDFLKKGSTRKPAAAAAADGTEAADDAEPMEVDLEALVEEQQCRLAQTAEGADSDDDDGAVHVGAAHRRAAPAPPAAHRAGRGRLRSQPQPLRKTDAGKQPRWLKRRVAKIAKLRSDIGALGNAQVEGLTATLSGSMCKRFQTWAAAQGRDELMYFLLEYGLGPWREFFDAVHANPKSLKLPDFMHCVFDSKRARPASVEYALKLTLEGLDDLAALKEHRVPVTYLRKRFKMANVSDDVKACVAGYTDLKTVVWWYEDLQCAAVDAVLKKRLEGGESLSFGYGKMMERLMAMHSAGSDVFNSLVPAAERTLRDYTLPLKTPLAVLGDCSGSMHVAVRTGSIIVSLLAALTGGEAELMFFNRVAVPPIFMPRTIKDVLMLSHFTKADGATSPASALEGLYLAKRRVETLLVVSDEQENECGDKTKLMFTQLVEKYMAEVNPGLRVVLISFLPSKVDASDARPAEQQLQGQMFLDLEAAGVKPLQLRIDGTRPDLSKVDFLLGRLSSESKTYELGARLLTSMLQWAPLGDVAAIAMAFRQLGHTFVHHAATAAACSLTANAESADAESTAAFGAAVADVVSAGLMGGANADTLSGLLARGAWGELRSYAERWTEAVPEADTMRDDEAPVPALTLNREVLKNVLEYLPAEKLKGTCINVCRGWRYIAAEAAYDASAKAGRGKYGSELQQLEAFGLVDEFGAEKCMAALERNRGHVERCIGSLYGEE